MSIFNKLFGIPTQQELSSIEDKVQLQDTNLDAFPDGALAHISFILLESNDIHTVANWADQSDEIARLYALMLHHIFVGDLEDLVVSQLKESANSGIIENNFARNIYKELISLKQNSDTNPVILPSQALKLTSMLKDEE